ncbi:GNAT family N-acetyltransferase [Pseudomonas citronellolis]|uniref:GNAT family N-acetyltransferase n=1 Tax=Pseudomonas citronellolis TaxID=53408 RepID=UPI0023E3F4BB|nr:GNAT family N-acetyltransferase [Pseudomonas citronellolis]MDF3931850.1 GNAT family N-acetyltransferase [Pseudomonas citronellolis]
MPTPLHHHAAALAAAGHDHWIETLDDGSHVLIRPLRAEDRELERDFLERLSPMTRKLRFHGEVKISDALLDRLMDVDYQQTMAFVALAHDSGELREVGISRYAAAAENAQCECALTTADDWKRRGLEKALMRHLIEVAKRNGFAQMYSIDQAIDREMRDLAVELGFQAQRDPDDATRVIRRLAL